MIFRKWTVFLLSSLLALSIWSALPAQQTAAKSRSALEALPEETTILLRLRNASDLLQKLKKSPLSTVGENPSFKKFIENITKKIEEELADARKKLGFNPMDLSSQVEGEVVLAVGGLDKIAAAIAAEMNRGGGGPPDVSPGDLPVLMVADAGGSASKLRESIGKIYEAAQKEGARKEEEDFRGGKITTLTSAKKDKDNDKDKNKENNPAPQEGLEKLFIGELGSTFLVSINRPFLEATMAGMSGAAMPSIGKNADFMATHNRLETDSDVLLFLNVKAVADAIRKNMQGNPMAPLIWNFIEGKFLGRGLKNFGISGSVREDGIYSISFVNNGGAKEGLLGLLNGPSFAASEGMGEVPEDIDYYSSFSVDMPGIYALIKDIATMAMSLSGNAQPGMDLEQYVEMNFQIKLKEVVAALGSKLSYYGRFNKDAPAGPLDPFSSLGSFLFSLELKSEEPIRDLISKVAILSGGGLQSEKYLERDVFKLSPTAQNGPVLALSNKLLVMGMSDPVKELIRRQGKSAKSLADNPGFQTAAKKVPGQVTAVSYTSEGYTKHSFDMFKALDVERELGFPLPDFEVIGSAFGASIGYGAWVENGLFFKSLVLFRKVAGK